MFSSVKESKDVQGRRDIRFLKRAILISSIVGICSFVLFGLIVGIVLFILNLVSYYVLYAR